MTEQPLENTVNQYFAGLQLCDGVVNLENYIKEIEKGKKDRSSLDFSQLAASLITKGNNGNLFVDGQPAHTEYEAKKYIKDQGRAINKFVTDYKDKLMGNYVSGLESTLNEREDIKKIKEKLASTEGEVKNRIIEELRTSAAEIAGFLLSKQYEEVTDNASNEIKEVTQEINEMNSWGEQKDNKMDALLTKKYGLGLGTKGLHLNYDREYNFAMAVNYRQLGSNFVSVDEQGNIKVDLDKYKDAYATNENLKKTAALFVSMIREANMQARQAQE